MTIASAPAADARGRRGLAAAVVRDAVDYVRHPRGAARRAMTERGLAEATVVTVLAVVVSAVPPTLVPATDNPPSIPRVYVVGLTWLGAHRVMFALLAAGGLLVASLLGYLLTCLAVRLLRPPQGLTPWRSLLAGLGWINVLSLVSALVPLPAVVMQIGHVPGYIPAYLVLIPPAIVLTVFVGVAACWTLRNGAGLSLTRALVAFLLPIGVVGAAGTVAVAAGFQLAWGGV